MRDPEGLGGKDYPLPKEGDEDKKSNNPDSWVPVYLGRINMRAGNPI